MRRLAIALLALSAATATASPAQRQIGEVRLFGTAAWAPGADVASSLPGGYPTPEGRAMVGTTAGLSFVTGKVSAGPEVLLLRGSDRRMFAVGAVGRLELSRSAVRPYLLIGAGVYTWNHRGTLPAEFNAPGQPIGPFWLGDVTQWSANAGGGVLVGRQRLSLVVEIRGHRSLNQDDWSGSRQALALSVGGRMSW